MRHKYSANSQSHIQSQNQNQNQIQNQQPRACQRPPSPPPPSDSSEKDSDFWNLIRDTIAFGFLIWYYGIRDSEFGIWVRTSPASCLTTATSTRMSTYGNTPLSRSCWSIARTTCGRSNASRNPPPPPPLLSDSAGTRSLPSKRSRTAGRASTRPAMTKTKSRSKSRRSIMWVAHRPRAPAHPHPHPPRPWPHPLAAAKRPLHWPSKNERQVQISPWSSKYRPLNNKQYCTAHKFRIFKEITQIISWNYLLLVQ